MPAPASDALVALFKAVEADDASSLLALLSGGQVSVSQPWAGSLNTALHMACARGKVVCVRALLGWPGGCTVDAGNAHLDTPLHFAAMSGAAGAAGLLLKAGASPRARNADGSCPLAVAAGSGQVGVLQVLLRVLSDADVVAVDNERRSALHFAAAAGSAACCEALLSRGVDVRARCSAGRSPLGEALHVGAGAECVQLLQRHADAHAADDSELLLLQAQPQPRRTPDRKAVAPPSPPHDPAHSDEELEPVAAETCAASEEQSEPVAAHSGVVDDAPGEWTPVAAQGSSRRRPSAPSHPPAQPPVLAPAAPRSRAAPSYASVTIAPLATAIAAAIATPAAPSSRCASPRRDSAVAAHLAMMCPVLAELDVHVAHVCGLDLALLSASQLEALQSFHAAQLKAVGDATLALARHQARAQALEESALQNTFAARV